jgi:hypothetical protein
MKPALLCLLLLTTTLSAQLSPKPPDAVLPVVGSTRGGSNANFKTELQFTNPGETKQTGWIVLRPQVISQHYELLPHATVGFADVVAELGGSGLGSIDILADTGGVPTIVARAYDDQPGGTTGVTVPAIPAGDVLSRGALAALIVPRDLTRYRFNVGVRALGDGLGLELTVRNPDGTAAAIRSLAFQSHEFAQSTGDVFAGTQLQPNQSIEIRLSAGSGIVYATTVDNATNDSSIQVLRR